MQAYACLLQVEGTIATAKKYKDEDKVLVFENMTNQEGMYNLREISPELYDLTFEMEGYVPLVKSNISINGGEHIDLSNIDLTPVNG